MDATFLAGVNNDAETRANVENVRMSRSLGCGFPSEARQWELRRTCAQNLGNPKLHLGRPQTAYKVFPGTRLLHIQSMQR